MNQKREVETRTAQFEVCSAVVRGRDARSGRRAVENFIVISGGVVDVDVEMPDALFSPG